VTTKKFLEAFGFASLRDLPDLERFEADGLLQRGQRESDLDSALGLADEEDEDAFERQNGLPPVPWTGS
jgi:segregation and condensation protein B